MIIIYLTMILVTFPKYSCSHSGRWSGEEEELPESYQKEKPFRCEPQLCVDPPITNDGNGNQQAHGWKAQCKFGSLLNWNSLHVHLHSQSTCAFVSLTAVREVHSLPPLWLLALYFKGQQCRIFSEMVRLLDKDGGQNEPLLSKRTEEALHA